MATEVRATRRPVELRAGGGAGGAPVIGGYAAVFERLSQNLGGFVERVAPGAFDVTLRDAPDVVCRWNHDDGALLGRTSSGTLRLGVDGDGLTYECDLPDTAAGNDVAVLAGRGDVRASSFAFVVVGDEWGVTEQGFPMRTLTAVSLHDVAPVTTPAYPDTSAALRSLAGVVGVEPVEVAGWAPEQVASALAAPAAPVVVDLGAAGGGRTRLSARAALLGRAAGGI